MAYQIVTKQFDYLSVQTLAQSLRVMAILDIIMTPAEEDWLRLVKKRPQETVYDIENGGGDTLVVVFAGLDALIKGFDHENTLNPLAADVWTDAFLQETYAHVPKDLLASFADEEAMDYTTFVMWYDDSLQAWQQNAVVDNDGGKAYLLGYICTNAAQWAKWATDYFEITIALDTVEKVYGGENLTIEDIAKLNPKRDGQAALAEIAALDKELGAIK